ncbi:MAG: hypothetical protein ACXIVQ_08540 [Acidimicrobiales bacterium]
MTDREGLPAPGELVDRARELATEALAVSVGLGILGVNRAQALRRRAWPPRPSGPNDG